MSEARLLVLVSCHPEPSVLARRAGAALFPALRRLEDDGLVTSRRGLYRVTRRGQSELELHQALARAVARAA
jgi:DNA-binding PadR family transcriptional regulator